MFHVSPKRETDHHGSFLLQWGWGEIGEERKGLWGTVCSDLSRASNSQPSHALVGSLHTLLENHRPLWPASPICLTPQFGHAMAAIQPWVGFSIFMTWYQLYCIFKCKNGWSVLKRQMKKPYFMTLWEKITLDLQRAMTVQWLRARSHMTCVQLSVYQRVTQDTLPNFFLFWFPHL